LKELIANGDKKVAVITPSFISDCLETLFEIGEEYKHEFMEGGGTDFQLVPNLNNEPVWFSSVFEIAKNYLVGFPSDGAEAAA
jgi:ferrochelatase